jgi:DNA-3-methyladenine glycosylase II
MPPQARRAPPPDPVEVAAYLARADPVLAAIVDRLGPLDLPHDGAGFPSLVRAIVFQQISGAAGAAIMRRIRAAYGRRGFPSVAWFQGSSPASLRAAGLSPQKLSYVHDLARHVSDGRLDFAQLPALPDDEVVEALTAVKGIGPWTAQMYLIFSLHRPDVLPAGDLGVRKAVGRAWGFRSLPAERTVERLGRRWAPYRSYASYYLWQSLSEAPDAGGPLKLEGSR